MCLDGRKDATLTLLTGDNGNQYQGCNIEEHYVVVGEPFFQFTHFVLEYG